MFSIMFAPLDLAMATAHRLHCRHANIQGNLREPAGEFAPGSRYEANEISALRWVYATLVDSAVLAYELVLPPLSPAECDQYYAESLRTAALFGIPRDALPPDWADFANYMRATLESGSLAVTSAAREMAQELKAGAGLPVRTPFWYGALTTHLLPASLRVEFQLPYGDVERRSAQRAVRWLRRLYSSSPACLALCRALQRSSGAACRQSSIKPGYTTEQQALDRPEFPFQLSAGTGPLANR